MYAISISIFLFLFLFLFILFYFLGLGPAQPMWAGLDLAGLAESQT
jgi:pilus assembly protein TadC